MPLGNLPAKVPLGKLPPKVPLGNVPAKVPLGQSRQAARESASNSLVIAEEKGRCGIRAIPGRECFSHAEGSRMFFEKNNFGFRW